MAKTRFFAAVDRGPLRPCAEQIAGSRRANVIVRTISPSTGFHWSDAGIGAAGGLGLAMLGVGGVLALSRRRERQVRSSATG